MHDLDKTVRMIADRPLAEIIALLDREATEAGYAARRTRNCNGIVGEKRARAMRQRDRIAEFYSFCRIVRLPLGRQKKMTISATCLHNGCRREENGDACTALISSRRHAILVGLQRPARDRRIFGKCRNPEMMVHITAVAMQTARARE
jgi:hypothetical protein